MDQQLPESKRRKIRDIVFHILQTADLETATEQSVRTTAAEQLEEPPPTLGNSKSKSNGAVEKGSIDFLPEEADVSLPNGNNGRVICKCPYLRKLEAVVKVIEQLESSGSGIWEVVEEPSSLSLSDKRSVGILDIQGKPFVSIRDFYEKDGKLVPSSRDPQLFTLDELAEHASRLQAENETANESPQAEEEERNEESHTKEPETNEGSQADEQDRNGTPQVVVEEEEERNDVPHSEGNEGTDGEEQGNEGTEGTPAGTEDGDGVDADTPSIEKSTIGGERRGKRLNDQDGQSSTGSDNDETSNDSDPNSFSIDTVIKIVNFEKYGVKVPLDWHKDYDTSIVVRSVMGKGWKEFMTLLDEEGLEDFFRKSCFGHFLDLSKDLVARFHMNLVHDLLIRRILCRKRQEVWINYCGIPVCFGMNEFALMTGLRCHSPPADEELKKARTDGQKLLDFVGKKITGAKLFALLKSSKVTKDYKESLCLVWFLHSILCAKDLNKNVEADWIRLSWSKTIFNKYPWGRESFDLTVDYLLRELKPSIKTFTLYGFPWAFMAWAFEAIPHFRHQVKDFSIDMSCPRMFRWLTAKATKTNIDPFKPPKDSEVAWTTDYESVATTYLFVGATSINRDWTGVIESDARSGCGEGGERRSADDEVALRGNDDVVGSVAGGERRVDDVQDVVRICDGGGCGERSAFLGVDVGGNAPYTPLERGGNSYVRVGTSKVPCCCERDKYKENQKELRKGIKDLKDASERIENAIKDLISKRGIKRGSKLTSPYTPLAQKRRSKHCEGNCNRQRERSSFPAIMEAIATTESKLRLTTGGNQAVVEVATQASEQSNTNISLSVDQREGQNRKENGVDICNSVTATNSQVQMPIERQQMGDVTGVKSNGKSDKSSSMVSNTGIAMGP
ncbi:hypothetical protein RND71_028455 [Anisodus tanguticus]|uniref:DUF1985 domain-containing protein n=1 Tax=Anisodus tanguticus TaxID=243964 RepID=A0AAE1RLH8_9SOLA|nr:hypothetical protein RND71_028455 [Anisodus tanguticus]